MHETKTHLIKSLLTHGADRDAAEPAFADLRDIVLVNEARSDGERDAIVRSVGLRHRARRHRALRRRP